eukprot:CAMPEP_0183344606 /NCGR_PEP_ID=MMETSP0164_2-20130417/10241_1 /TAXON_ID=221442 /ORGANISM="Coccolithus pelagicus ssp braarudi, Strain PLY182g" /LENGTH=308 /DNA_ID=CAMNT_0025515625 /DNA_START=15 /DNA_END=941 /DNA_ORIENTATION=+
MHTEQLRAEEPGAQDVVIDTVQLSAANSSQKDWRTRGTGAVICYNGLTRGNGFDGGRSAYDVLRNHMRVLIQPLHAMFGSHLVVAFSIAGNGSAISLNAPRLAIDALDKLGIAHRAEDRSSAASGHKLVHPQYLGTEHCGNMITRLQVERAAEFAFAVSLRYDLLLSTGLQVQRWPVWVGSRRAAPLLALAKYELGEPQLRITRFGAVGCPGQMPARRCMPQDVFYVVRNVPKLGPVQTTFLSNHSVVKRFPGGRGKDFPEAQTFAAALSAGVSIAVVWQPSACPWLITLPRVAFFGRCKALRAIARN